jgi:hypothetical protein
MDRFYKINLFAYFHLVISYFHTSSLLNKIINVTLLLFPFHLFSILRLFDKNYLYTSKILFTLNTRKMKKE